MKRELRLQHTMYVSLKHQSRIRCSFQGWSKILHSLLFRLSG